MVQKKQSQAEVLASTKQFFANIPTEDQRTPSEVYERNKDNVVRVPTTTIVTATTSIPTSPTMLDTNLRGTGLALELVYLKETMSLPYSLQQHVDPEHGCNN